MMQRSQWEEETSGPTMNLPRVPCTSDNSTTSTAPLLQLHQNLQHTQRASKNIVEYDLCRSISPHYSRFTNGTHTITWTPLISSLSLSADNKQPSVYIVITKYQPKNQPNINFLWQFFYIIICFVDISVNQHPPTLGHWDCVCHCVHTKDGTEPKLLLWRCKHQTCWQYQQVITRDYGLQSLQSKYWISDTV